MNLGGKTLHDTDIRDELITYQLRTDRFIKRMYTTSGTNRGRNTTRPDYRNCKDGIPTDHMFGYQAWLLAGCAFVYDSYFPFWSIKLFPF
jgi:hypothetical protein